MHLVALARELLLSLRRFGHRPQDAVAGVLRHQLPTNLVVNGVGEVDLNPDLAPLPVRPIGGRETDLARRGVEPGVAEQPHWRADRTEVLPEPFSALMTVTGRFGSTEKSRETWRRSLKF